MEFVVLKDAGLSPAESAVYLALLELGQTKAGPVIDRTELQPSVVYLALHGLLDKGLVSTVMVGKHKRYAAASPTILRDLLEERRQRLETVIPQLLARKPLLAQQRVELYEGIEGLQTLFFTLIADAKRGEVLRYFDAEDHDQADRAKLVYLPFHARVRERGIIIRGIHNRGGFPTEVYQEGADIRFTREIVPPDTSIFRDTLVLVSWSEKPTGVLIQSAPLARQYTKLWDAVWSRSEQ